MMKIVTGCYSNYRVNIPQYYGEWNEYFPPSEEAFREIATAIVIAFSSNKRGIRIASVNAALKHLDISMHVNYESTLDEWVDAYWQLYRRGFIYVAYRVDDRARKQMFAYSSNDMARTMH